MSQDFCVVLMPDYPGYCLEIITPGGDKLPGILSVSLDTDPNTMATVTIKMVVKLPWQISYNE